MLLRQQLRASLGELFLGVVWLLGKTCRARWARGIYVKLLVRLVGRTGLFDGEYYSRNNADVAAANVLPLRHYVAFGDVEGRPPHWLFDPVYYRLHARGRFRDVVSLLHYVYVGRYRGFAPSPWFDIQFYLKENDDVRRAGIEPLRHYLRHGGREGRSPSPQFDGAYYLSSNPDVAEARMNPLVHYLRYGQAEGRQPLPPRHEPSNEQHRPLLRPAAISRQAWNKLGPRGQLVSAQVDVIVPVYKGHVETLRCLYSVLTSQTDVPFELIVINDASPEPELAAELISLSERDLFTLVVNAENRGFVYTVNRGMTMHRQRDVVLLNSDTEVFDGWLDRLTAAASRSERTGTVTPLSNNATICSYPNFLQDNPYPLEVSYAELDGLAARVNKAQEVRAPTAVGFCTFIKRACLDEVGLFDEKTFGKGYGEENDFSQRALAKGWQNVIAGDVFVYHSGSASFEGEKAGRIHAAIRILDRLYPNYHRDVAAFIKSDPLRVWRERLDWARMRRLSRERNVLIIVHARGGGTERHVQEDVQSLSKRGYSVFLMRTSSRRPTHLTISHPIAKATPNLQPLPIADTTYLGTQLRHLGITEVHTHSLVDAVLDAPRHVKNLVDELGARWEVNLHDYKVICPRINLVDDQGRYCNEPDDRGCNRCLGRYGSSFGKPDIRDWRRIHSDALLAADQILVPDGDVSARLERYYPGLRFDVSPHDDIDDSAFQIRPLSVETDEALHVLTIGALSKIKGFDVLLACARDASKRELPIRFTLMGYSVDDRSLERAGVHVTGRYLDTQGLQLLRELRPHVVWLPSLWPETYSYTLSLALRYGRPVVAFDIGAIAARLRRIGEAEMLVPLSLAQSPKRLSERFEDLRGRWITEDFGSKLRRHPKAIEAVRHSRS